MPKTVPNVTTPSIEAVALLDLNACAALGSASKSWFLGEVAAKRAPAPVVRRHRFMRWRATEVAAFYAQIGA